MGIAGTTVLKAAVAIYCNDTVCCGRGVTKEYIRDLDNLQMVCLW